MNQSFCKKSVSANNCLRIFSLIIFVFPLLFQSSCGKEDVKSSANSITSFQLEIEGVEYDGIINPNNGKITFMFDEELPSSLIPKIKFSEKATISPNENNSQNFNDIVSYTVTAENGLDKTYTVVVENSTVSDSNSIPGPMEFVGVEFNGREMTIDWTDATDTDEITYYVYKNSVEIGQYGTSTATMSFTYNQIEHITIFATDEKGGTSELSFDIEAPESELLFITNFSGILYAIDTRVKDILWLSTTRRANNSPRIMDNTVTTILTDSIVSLNLLNGDFESKLYEQPYGIPVNFASDDNQYYFGLGSNLLALGTAEKTESWTTYIDQRNVSSSSPMVIDQNHVYVMGRDKDFIMAINKITGNPEWSFDVNGAYYADASPIIVGENIIVGNSNKIYGLNRTSGNLTWEYEILNAGDLIRGMAFKDDTLVVVAGNQMVSLDATTGEPIWEETLPAFVGSSPYIYEDKIYAGEYGNGRGSLMTFSLSDGKLLWRRTVSNTVYASPIAVDDKVYFADGDGFLYCLDTENGTELWKMTVGAHVRTSPTFVRGNSKMVIYPENQVYD